MGLLRRLSVQGTSWYKPDIRFDHVENRLPSGYDLGLSRCKTSHSYTPSASLKGDYRLCQLAEDNLESSTEPSFRGKKHSVRERTMWRSRRSKWRKTSRKEERDLRRSVHPRLL